MKRANDGSLVNGMKSTGSKRSRGSIASVLGSVRGVAAGVIPTLVVAAIALATSTNPSLAQSGGDAPGGANPWIGQIFLFGSFGLIFYFLLIRPQQKRQKTMQKMLSALKKGDRVLTSGGMYGEVQKVEDDVVTLKISDTVKADFAKSAVSSVVSAESSSS